MKDITNQISRTKQCPVYEFILALGKNLLLTKRQDWVDMDAVATFAKDRNLHLNDEYPSADELEPKLRELFQRTPEIYGDDVVIDGYPRRAGWSSVFMIRAYPYCPSQPIPSNPTRILDPETSLLENDSTTATEINLGRTNTRKSDADTKN